jgi:hypothetical protein
MFTKALVSATVVAGSILFGAGIASADPSPSDPNQNPFGALTVTGQDATPVAGGPSVRGDIQRGLRGGLGN